MIKKLKYTPARYRNSLSDVELDPCNVYFHRNGNVEDPVGGIDAICWSGLRSFLKLPKHPCTIYLCLSDKPVKGADVFHIRRENVSYKDTFYMDNRRYSMHFRRRTGYHVWTSFRSDCRELWVWVELPV